jgi:ABC-2 type transport system permease protein
MRQVLSDILRIPVLLKPRMRSFHPAMPQHRKQRRRFRILFTAAIGISVWAGIFVVSYRVLSYFKSIEELGDLLAFKLLSMVLITLFSLLIFSSIITCLAKLYLSKDLQLVHSMPVPAYAVFLSRWFESTIDSAWMVITYTLPVLVAYGIIYRAGIGFYPMVLMNLGALSFAASGISALMVLSAVNLIPANRLRNIFVFLGLTLFVILYLAFRLLRPERLVDPEAFATALVYLKTLRAPASPFLPSTWAYDSLKMSLTGNTWAGAFHWLISFSFTIFMAFLNVLLADAVYFKGMSKAQTVPVRLFKSTADSPALSLMPRGPVRAFVTKEIKSFFRDQTQWSQLFLVAALFFIYIFNFSALPLEKAPIKTVYLQNILSFLNMGLATFVLVAVTARFAYPAVGAEGDAFWIVKSAPVSLRTFLWIKFSIYFLPLLLMTEAVIVTTNILLQVTPFMMILSTVTIFFVVPGIVSMGIGMGAAHPDFQSENPAQTVTSFGGLMFMMLSAGLTGLVIILEAQPVYRLFMADVVNRVLSPLEWVWTIACFTSVLGICLAAIYFPMKYGEKQLSRRIGSV